MKTIIIIKFFDKNKEDLEIVKDWKIDIKLIKESIINERFIDVWEHLINTATITDVKIIEKEEIDYVYDKICDKYNINTLSKQDNKQEFSKIFKKLWIEKIRKLEEEYRKKNDILTIKWLNEFLNKNLGFNF